MRCPQKRQRKKTGRDVWATQNEVCRALKQLARKLNHVIVVSVQQKDDP